MEFSRQEYWRGFPFPSPKDLADPGLNPGLLPCKQTLYPLGHQGRLVKVKMFWLWSALCDRMDYTEHGILQVRILEWVAIPFSRGSSQPRVRTQVSHIAGGFFTRWATREAREYGVGSLSLLQRIFLTQELNQGLLHCRWIFYQLNYQGSPHCLLFIVK